MKRLGLDYAVLAELNPRLIYCSITGYGQDGPYRDRAGHDINYLAVAGIAGHSGREKDGPPLWAFRWQILQEAHSMQSSVFSLQ